MRYFLNDTNPQLRQNGLKFFRYLIQANKTREKGDLDSFFNLLIKKHIPYFLCRSLERDLKEPKSQQMSSSQGPSVYL